MPIRVTLLPFDILNHPSLCIVKQQTIQFDKTIIIIKHLLIKKDNARIYRYY